MDLKKYIFKLWYKIVYLLGVICYLIRLNKLNKELLAQNFSSSWALLEYNKYAALKYFGIALLLFWFGCVFICRDVKFLREGLEEVEEIMISLLSIIVTIILLLQIIFYINNPILRAILIVSFASYSFISEATS